MLIKIIYTAIIRVRHLKQITIFMPSSLCHQFNFLEWMKKIFTYNYICCEFITYIFYYYIHIFVKNSYIIINA